MVLCGEAAADPAGIVVSAPRNGGASAGSCSDSHDGRAAGGAAVRRPDVRARDPRRRGTPGEPQRLCAIWRKLNAAAVASSKLQSEALKDAISQMVGDAKEKNRKFTEAVELQIGLKNYDPQKDKRFSGSVKLPHIPRPKMKVCMLGDAQHVEEVWVPWLLKNGGVRQRQHFGYSTGFGISGHQGQFTVLQMRAWYLADENQIQLKLPWMLAGMDDFWTIILSL